MSVMGGEEAPALPAVDEEVPQGLDHPLPHLAEGAPALTGSLPGRVPSAVVGVGVTGADLFTPEVTEWTSIRGTDMQSLSSRSRVKQISNEGKVSGKIRQTMCGSILFAIPFTALTPLFCILIGPGPGQSGAREEGKRIEREGAEE